MNILKLSIVIVFSFFTISVITAQYVWYENSSSTYNIDFESASKGIFTTDEPNPEIDGINPNATVSKFVRDGQEGSNIIFELNNLITDFSSYTISLKAHISIQTADFNSTNRRIRVYLKNTNISNSSIFKASNFTTGETWESFSFDFDGTAIPPEVIAAGGYDQMSIQFAAGDTGGLTSTYHVDAISGSSDQGPCEMTYPAIRNADYLSGSWGVRLNMFGGFRLDDSSDQLDWVAGAQEIVDNLPAVGHVITNATHPAQGYYYTLRDNPYVDVANEIHPAMVPSLENEQIILDVIDVFRNSGKKVILYLNGAGPGHLQGNSDVELEILTAWKAYYNSKYDGDEALAWRTLVKGYVERFEGLVDGYWLDNLVNLPGSLNEFVAVIKEADPNAIISTNGDPNYVTDENGEPIYVDSDGIDDEDPIDYIVKDFQISDPYMDITGGHPTPLGKGAPPNSWAYEEFLFPLIVENPWGYYEYECSKEALKHYFCPIRRKWSVSTADLMFEVEQAYRFVRTFTDAGACITWSTTQQGGLITDDEMAIMQEINNRMLQSPKPDYEPYVRPEGAYLVGEGPLSINAVNEMDVIFYPNPVTSELTITRASSDINHIQLISSLGTLIIDRDWDSGTLSTQLDLSDLNAGVYFLNIANDENQSITRRIIIAK